MQAKVYVHTQDDSVESKPGMYVPARVNNIYSWYQ